MNKEKIGQAAGLVWDTLNSKDEVSLAQLPRLTKLTSDLTYQALGWLAREDKIDYHTKAGKVYIALTEKERVLNRVGH